MPIDLTLTGLSGDGVVDVSAVTTFTDMIVHVTALGPRSNPTTSDPEKVLNVGYLEMGSLAGAPFSGTYYDPASLWLNNIHNWFSVSHYNWIGPNIWDKIRYHLTPGNVIDLWLTH